LDTFLTDHNEMWAYALWHFGHYNDNLPVHGSAA